MFYKQNFSFALKKKNTKYDIIFSKKNLKTIETRFDFTRTSNTLRFHELSISDHFINIQTY